MGVGGLWSFLLFVGGWGEEKAVASGVKGWLVVTGLSGAAIIAGLGLGLYYILAKGKAVSRKLRQENLDVALARKIIEAAEKKESGFEILLGILENTPHLKARNYEELRKNISDNLQVDLSDIDEKGLRRIMEVVWFHLINTKEPGAKLELKAKTVWGDELIFMPVFPEQRWMRFKDFAKERDGWQNKGYILAAVEDIWNWLGRPVDMQSIFYTVLLQIEAIWVRPSETKNLAIEKDILLARWMKWTLALRRLEVWLALRFILPLIKWLSRIKWLIQLLGIEMFTQYYNLSQWYLRIKRDEYVLTQQAGKPTTLDKRFFLPG